jgi:hypothetical protein
MVVTALFRGVDPGDPGQSGRFMVASRPFRPKGQPASAVLAALAGLWDQAAASLAGKGNQPLTQKRLAAASGVSESALSSWSRGEYLPQDPDQLAEAGRVLARWADTEAPSPREWSQMLEADRAARGTPSSPGGPGQPIAGLDPFVLEVHRPVISDSGGAGLPALPPYVRRTHDEDLAAIVGRAAGGRSGMAVLVGGSLTGKTRACWEALSLLPARWRLWHPYDPIRPEAALADVGRVGPRTVVWLAETQLYLNTPGDTGERVAAALTRLLTDPARGPVLVLGTLWPVHWDALTQDRHGRPQACALLDGTSIPVPTAFTGPALAELKQAGASDPRLAAAAGAADGQATQYLAGAPVLLARYRNAPPEARALIEAAMDACRLGHSPALPRAFLEAAAPAYLTDAEWDLLGEDWLEQALTYATAPCKGAAGPITRIRPRSASGRPGGGSPSTPTSPVYKLADYLDQHGRRHRASQYPPDGFWGAAANRGSSGSLAALADAAGRRGLDRHAAQLRKNATRHGESGAAAALVAALYRLDSSDYGAARWAAAHVTLDDPFGVTQLLKTLQMTGAGEQFAELAARAAVGVALDDPPRVAYLLDRLREAAATEQVNELLARNPAAAAPLTYPFGVARLLDSLRKAGAAEQVTELAARAADGTPLDDPTNRAELLTSLRRAAPTAQFAELLAARNPAVGAILNDPSSVAVLLDSLWEAGAAKQFAELGAWAAADAPLDEPRGVAELLNSLRRAGPTRHVAKLLARDPGACAPLDDPFGVAELLTSLRRAGAGEQFAELAARATADTPLGRLNGVAELLDVLWMADAVEQAAELAARAAAAAPLDDPSGVARLLGSLRRAGTAEQVTELAARAAASAPLDKPRSVARLLDSLRWVGAPAQFAELASRAALDAPLTDPSGVSKLVDILRDTGAAKQFASLATRLPAVGLFGLHPDCNSQLYQFGREPDGRPAAAWGWPDLD